MGLAFSPDGSRLATAGQDGTVKVLDAGGAVALTLKAFDMPCMRVAFSPDGRHLAACGSDWLQPRRIGEVRVWDAATGNEVSRPGGHRAGLGGVLFAPDGRLLTVCYDGQLRFWDAAAGQAGQTVQDNPGPIVAASLSPDGRLLAVGRLDRAVAAWDVATGARRYRLPMPQPVWAVAFSPDGKLLAVGGGDQQTQQGFLTLLDADTGTEVESTTMHVGMVLALDFHPTEPRLASGEADGTVLLWDTTEHRLALTLRGHVSGVAAVAFSPDGRRLVSAGRDRSVRIWEAAPPE
jgi:WD40 repeat protein